MVVCEVALFQSAPPLLTIEYVAEQPGTPSSFWFTQAPKPVGSTKSPNLSKTTTDSPEGDINVISRSWVAECSISNDKTG